MEENNIQLRSDEVQEILGQVPSRMIRYGVSVILGILVILIVGSCLFSYPDIITASSEVVTKNPPAQIVAKTSGALSQILVVDSQLVQVGQVLAIIKNPAIYSDVDYLQKKIADYNEPAFNDDDYWPDTLKLGAVQSDYAAYVKEQRTYQQFMELGYHEKKLSALKNKQNELKKYVAVMEEQVSLGKTDYELSLKQFQRDSLLFIREVIAASDLEDSRKELLQDQMTVQSLQSQLISTRIELQELNQQIVELELDMVEQNNNYRQSLTELHRNLENQIAEWFDEYVLVSPIAGRVALNTIWGSNQYVEAGQQVFTVIPGQKQEVIGRVELSVEGAGKVKPGQRVNLKFDNYPYLEFGVIEANVKSIALVPLNQVYMADLTLPDSLVTNYGITLPFSQNMPATAEIITDNKALLSRIFNPIRSVLKQHWAH